VHLFIFSLASVVVFAHRRLRRSCLLLQRSTCLSVFSFSCFLALHASSTSACDHIPAGKSFWIRLLDPVASYSSKPGATIRAILIQSPECSDGPVFPAGLELEGEVIAVHKVGLGIKHETASLEVQFDRLVTANGDALPLAAQVVEIDNARETVRNGVIHGINATNSPQGRITSRLIHLPTYNPYSDLGLLTYRTIFSKLPEPEIYLPPGTDLRLQLNLALDVADQPELTRPSFQMDEYERGDVEMLLSKSSERTTTRSGKDADLVNILFVGSRDQIQQAFTASGWLPSDHNSTHAILKQFEAVLTFSNYPTMPISRQLLNGDPQTLTWQKSFDSYEKREHLRLWIEPSEVEGQEAWLGAYTRETSATFSIKYHNFIHHIDRNVDEGVLMLVRDLSLAGCVDSVRQLPRPDFPQLTFNSTGDEMHTDGVLNVVHLKDCERPAVEYSSRHPLVPVRPRSRVARYIRTQILLYKSDVVRGNLLYGGYDLTRMAIRNFHHHNEDYSDAGNLPISPVSPDTLFPTLSITNTTAAR
jgi:hypothetical protein